MIPPDGLDFFDAHGIPEHVLLTNRHHNRALREAFGCTVHCISNGLHEPEGRGPVEAFEFGDELPGGINVHEVDAICPDETALYIPSHRALACADGVVRRGVDEPLGFVPDSLMDEPERPAWVGSIVSAALSASHVPARCWSTRAGCRSMRRS